MRVSQLLRHTNFYKAIVMDGVKKGSINHHVLAYRAVSENQMDVIDDIAEYDPSIYMETKRMADDRKDTIVSQRLEYLVRHDSK